MTRQRLTDLSALFLGVVYIVAGIAETTRAVVTGDGGIAFWFGSLVGGGALILLGTLAVRDRPRRSCTLVCVGCLVGAPATMWTIVVPLVAVVVMVLAVLRAGEEGERREAGRT